MRPAPHITDDLVAIRADIAELRALVEKALSIQPVRTWLTTTEAAEMFGFSEQTIRAWCKLYRLGVFVRNEWQVDRAQLRAHVVARFGLGRLTQQLRDG
jgi:hypothetical protein